MNDVMMNDNNENDNEMRNVSQVKRSDWTFRYRTGMQLSGFSGIISLIGDVAIVYDFLSG